MEMQKRSQPYLWPLTSLTNRQAITILALAIASMLGGCALAYRNLEPPTAVLVDVRPRALQSGLSLGIVTRLQLFNPNDVELPVKGGQVEIHLNDQLVANSILAESFTLPANDSAEIDLPITIDLATGLAIGLNVLGSGSTALKWQLDGYVDMGTRFLGRVPLSESGTLSLDSL